MYLCKLAWGFSAGIVIGSNLAEVLLLIAVYAINRRYAARS
jgi:hypothetical protein